MRIISIAKKTNNAAAWTAIDAPLARLLTCFAFTIVLLGALKPDAARSAEWKPASNVEIVVSVAPGGGTDTTARMVQQMFDRLKLGASQVVNKPGGGGAEAWAYLQRHERSGTHLAISTPQLLTNRIMGTDPLNFADFTPITNLYNEYVLIAVRADSPLSNGRDLAARLRLDSAPLSIAVAPALGSHNHIAAALIAKAAGIDPRRLKVQVFKTGTEAAAAAMAGEADIVSSTSGTLLPLVQGGRLRALGLTAGKRLGGPFASVPTWTEQGIDVVLPSWRGVMGPRGMSPAQIAYWEDAFLKLSFSDEWVSEITKLWWEGNYLDSGETRRFLETQNTLLRKALIDVGLAR